MELERLKPTARQLSFMDWEMGAFFHFGIRTFYEGHRDWDGRPMPAAGFNPTRLDCDQHTIKSVAELMGIYDYSVGRGCNFLMNIPPDRRGVLPDADVVRLDEFGQALRKRFARPIDTAVTFEEDRVLVAFTSPEMANTLVLQEDLTEGQAVAGYQVLFSPGHIQGPLQVEVCRGASIGHKHIIRLPSLYAGSLEIRLSSRPGKTAHLKQVGVFR